MEAQEMYKLQFGCHWHALSFDPVGEEQRREAPAIIKL
jgi:hypothetical protein